MFTKEELEKPLPFPYYAWVIQSGKPKQIHVMSHKLLPNDKVQLIVMSTVLYTRTVAISELYRTEFEAKFAYAKICLLNNAEHFFELKEYHVQAATF